MKHARAGKRLATRQLRVAVTRLQRDAKQRSEAAQVAEAALQQERSKAAANAACLQALQAKLQRAEALVTKLEERRCAVRGTFLDENYRTPIQKPVLDQIRTMHNRAVEVEGVITCTQASVDYQCLCVGTCACCCVCAQNEPRS